MAFRQFCFSAATACLVLLTTGAVRAENTPLNLQQGEWSDAFDETEKESLRVAMDGDALPEAPDLEAIPFFTAADNAFYLRADVGFGALSAGDAITAHGRYNPGLTGPAIVGIGAGYRFGYVLRTDVTAEYRSRADIRTSDGFRSRISGMTALANLYADLGTWHGVTPYVGAGVGVSWSKLSDGAFVSSRHRTDFVWAVGGGFSIEVTPQMSVDIGYRYLHTGALRSTSLALRESGSHDLRVGLRWWLGGSSSGDLP